MTISSSAEFEALLKQLQATVAALEENDMPLKDAVEAYARAVEIANACNRLLDEAELRVREIDQSSRELREHAASYFTDRNHAAALLLGEDDDLSDLLDLDDLDE